MACHEGRVILVTSGGGVTTNQINNTMYIYFFWILTAYLCQIQKVRRTCSDIWFVIVFCWLNFKPRLTFIFRSTIIVSRIVTGQQGSDSELGKHLPHHVVMMVIARNIISTF